MARKIVSWFLGVIVFLTVGAGPVAAAKIMTSENGSVSVAKTEVVNDDLFAAGQTVNIEGTVNGDVFAAGQTVKISGTVTGSVHTGTSTLILGGSVKGNVYAGAQNILISGAKIGGSLIAGAATLDIDQDTGIGGSVLAGAGTFSLEANIGRNVMVGTGSLYIGDNARIGKDLYYSAGDKPDRTMVSAKAKIGGAVHKTEVKTPQKPEIPKKQAAAFLGGIKLIGTVVGFLGALVVAFIYLKLFPREYAAVSQLLSTSFWKCTGVGFLVIMALIPGVIMLLFTGIGIPLAGLGVLVFLLYMYLTKFAAGGLIGNWIANKFGWKMSTYWTLALGLTAFYLLRAIPFVGFLAGLVVLWSGLGAQILRLFEKK